MIAAAAAATAAPTRRVYLSPLGVSVVASAGLV